MTGPRWAAVALVLRPRGERLHLLLIRRARRPADPWSGDVAFPGGLRDPEDAEPLDTARRESLEEVGIDPGVPVGALDERLAFHPRHLRPMAVRPYVFVVGPQTEAVPGDPEVAEILWAPLDELLAPERRRWRPHRLRGRVPLLVPQRPWAGHRIWGLTGAMLDDLSRRLQRPPHSAKGGA
jgi:8-oxo-dGTP pyrophosphatase MutT (NUDIX family)